MAKFEKGHKLAKGGKRDGAGRKTNERKEAEKLAADIAREYIEKHVVEVLEVYLQTARVDAPTTRHWIDKFVPAAKQQLELTGGIKIVRVNAFDPDAK